MIMVSQSMLQSLYNYLFVWRHMAETLWVDRYRPKTMDKLSYNYQVNNTLKQLAKTTDFPHLILYGPEGAGKKTRTVAFIQEVFGVNSLILTKEQWTIKLEGSTKVIEFPIISSPFHIQITPADNQYDDRHIIQHTVKTLAASKNINHKSEKKIKILVINEADRLTKQAQGALRRTMEKYIEDCRMVLICNSVHKLIMPIRSRCVNIRVPSPTNEDIADFLKYIAKQQLMELSDEALRKIIKVSRRNMLDAVSQLQCYKYTKKPDADILNPFHYEIKEITKLIYQDQSPMQLQKIRGSLYDLLVNCVEPNLILTLLLEELIQSRKINDQFMKDLIHKAAHLESTLAQGSKAIIHLECFVAHAMQSYMGTKQAI